ncbi:thiamine phosphate synthase [Chlorobium phaeobacteroides]|jgi:thiamine-phosphate pyrophosphorylase|uniref:Thiamine-phosphate synthase n=1 Tax=Chlorobium phaeobacteroides (strain DSM 266 / SMG 266 / 2430) TaxID=290317 RepID=THIE_CHLPD|nr:thiamine phosphate synthase [Chlorobium phaeobacteroides]A1BGM7.1 RecName: Full=Thiamine-phosphate synthase; Short=TP synthase; Short=TPS; AltName: Full=Thiamine-phosphate pyrophosphorylase; Short=TMP pyrophosphorylase; Short=TMP-PPase [Chlorobium phaeobacteroides DSM 266]ABL65554.1 thiamine-phosphate diphosphorylase [Chlorobium phaeobacteroides DSM 266]MBV5326670.1 thiamine phosphate synthase [Chlorobium sp.]
MIPAKPFLCVITDEQCSSPVDLALMALEGGAEMIQLRHKSASGKQLFQWALDIQRLCRIHHAQFIVNDRVDIALAMNADGVHLGQQDLQPGEARKLLGTDKIIGVSTSSLTEALNAERAGADYIGFGHIFQTGSKNKLSAPLGSAAISAVVQRISIPLVAIGGINKMNMMETIAAGASGIAMIAAISRTADPEGATRAITELLKGH